MDRLDQLIEAFVAGSRSLLGKNLVGVYLHGSAAMGCFNPEQSDVDLLTVVREPVPDAVKREYMDLIVALDARGPKKGIEMSVVRRSVCKPFAYPTPFELHFSRAHLEWYRRDPADYVARMNGADRDLAAHFTVLRRRGRCLCGAPIDEVFGEVPRECYIDSIRADVEDAEREIGGDPVYYTLNLCRVLGCLRDGLVLSKQEGGLWAAERVPEPHRAWIRRALEAYASGLPMSPDPDAARAFAAHMLGEIRT